MSKAALGFHSSSTKDEEVFVVHQAFVQREEYADIM